MLYPPFRRTTIHDVSTLAEFVEVASERLALYLWTKLAGGGRDPSAHRPRTHSRRNRWPARGIGAAAARLFADEELRAR